jgi:hypothetical protein
MIAARRSGYILIETAVALALLSAGSFAVHRTIQEGIRTRGQAQDFTRARFLLDGVTNDALMQPQLREGSGSGRFSGGDARFSWAWTVRRVGPPAPKFPLRPPRPGDAPKPFRSPEESAYLAHVRVAVRWERGGMPFAESYETLLAPERLWQPPRMRRAPAP